jgi:ACS family 4-hydroxyphenylacetate permease-like MFS transporter
MFGLAATLFYVTYVLCGIPSNIMLARIGARRWIAGIVVCVGHCVYLYDVRHQPADALRAAMLVGIAEAGFLPGSWVSHLVVPAYHRARANAVYDCHAGDHDARLDPRAIFWRWTGCGT